MARTRFVAQRSLLALAAAVGSTAAAHADTPYLVGFVLYRSTMTGASVDSTYFYTSNSNIGALRQTLTPGLGADQTAAISFPLLPGSNTFTFAPVEGVDPDGFAGVQLYFSSNGNTFEPLGSGFAPDLAAFVPTEPGPWAYVPANANMIDYGNSFGAMVPYSGATSFIVGDNLITITALSINRVPAGSVTLSVTQVPAPASVALVALAGLAARRRR